MPDAGKLRDKIVFEQRGLDANGDRLGAFQPELEAWAQMVWLRGSEAVLQQRLEGRQPVALVIRDTAQARAITPAWRARDKRSGDTFNITAVSPSKERGFLDVLAVKGGATG